MDASADNVPASHTFPLLVLKRDAVNRCARDARSRPWRALGPSQVTE